MQGRHQCLVPFCRRWRGRRKGDPPGGYPDGFEWLCSDHWRRLTTKVERKVWRRAYRRRQDARSFGVESKGGRISFASRQRWLDYDRARDAEQRIWDWMKAMAVERAAGSGM